MNIQNILFPEIGKCTETELYFRTKDKAVYNSHKKALSFREGDTVSFDTYFNGFSIDKWKKYTILNNLSLELRVLGKFKITLLCKEKIHEDIFDTIVSETYIDAEEIKTVVLAYPIADVRGMLVFSLEALEDGSEFYGGSYVSDISRECMKIVKIGIAICTFKRESFVEKNLNILQNAILENHDSPLYGHLEVFIADNGQTLDIERLSSENIHINPNRNLGGAGGFTRDLIEIMRNNDKLQITHALLMDDDIVIEPEALAKTYLILSLLKEEYRDTFIGGAMLRLDQQYMQVESGAVWNGGYLDSLKHGLDLRTCDACLYNEIEEYAEFNAWWYCCFPMSIVTKDNLPLPIFIRGDDLEYGLRNMKNLILLNGICVWHEAFENKYSSFLEYYIIRNQLIDNSFHCQWYGKKQLMKTLLHHSLQEIMYYRYKNVELYHQGVKDFLKGPVWLMEQDGEALHKKIMSEGYRGQELSALPMAFSYPMYERSRFVCDKKIGKIKRFITFNGLFLPTRGENIVPMSAARSPQFYRMKRVMHYDVTSRKAFITEKSIRKSLKYIFKTFGLMFVIVFKLQKAQRQYRTEGLRLRTLDFWCEYLGLKQ